MSAEARRKALAQQSSEAGARPAVDIAIVTAVSPDDAAEVLRGGVGRIVNGG